MADVGHHSESESSLEPLRGDNIVLIGMRGSGKSTVAELLRVQTKKRIIDTDKMVEEKAGMPISEIVKTMGEKHFRELEDEAVQHASRQTNVIIATGGGAVTRPENIHALRQNSFVVWLKADIPVLEARTKGDSNRFPLNDAATLGGQMERTAHERKDNYEKTKDIAIDTTSISQDRVAKEIYHAIEQRRKKA